MGDVQLVIYPTARKVEDQLIRRSRGGSSVLGYRITTMPQVVEALWNETPDTRRSLSAIGERLVMREAVTRVRSKEPEIKLSPGTVDRMLALIRRLKSARIHPDDWAAANEALRFRPIALEASAKIFAAYQALLDERSIADSHDQEAIVLDFLLQCERSRTRPRYLFGIERLLVAEIYDLSLLQFMLIAALIRIIGDAELTIQAAPHKVDAGRFADLTWNRFVGEESIADKVLPDFVRREGRSGALGFLLEHVFTEAAPSPPPHDETVAIVEAPDPRAEADAVARRIHQLCANAQQPIDLSRSAIIARDLTLYSDHLKSAFDRYGLPLGIVSGSSLRGTTPARALLAITTIPTQCYRRDALIALCDNSFISHRIQSGAELLREIGYVDDTRPLRACLENRRRELNEALAVANEADLRRRIEANLRRLEREGGAWQELLDHLRPLETEATLHEHLQHLRRLIDWLRFDPVRGSLDDSAARASGALWATLDALEVEARRIAPSRGLEAQGLVDVLEEALREVELEPPAPVGTAVQVLSVMDARGLDFDRVFILGMNDGVFPQQHPDNPLLPEEVVRELNPRLRERLRRRLGADMPDAPGPILRSQADRNAEEPFLFFLALSMPARELVLSRAIEDEQGKPLGPSPYLTEVQRLLGFATTGLRTQRSGALPRSLGDCATERDYLNLAAMRGRLRDPALVSEAGPRAEAIARRIETERRRTSYLARPTRETMLQSWQKRHKKDWATPEALHADPQRIALVDRYTGRVAPNDALAEFLIGDTDGKPRAWSATRFSELAQCGFKFFARRLLRLREDDDAEYEQSRLETGSLVHRILYEIAEAKLDYGKRTEALEQARRITRRVETVERAAARDPAFFDAEWASVRMMIDEVIQYECERYARGERSDNVEAEYPLNFVLEGRDGTRIRIEGAIDRLEVARKAQEPILRVIDYKTSRNNRRLAPQDFATTDLQLPIYLLGAIEQLELRQTGDLTAEGGYIALRARDKATDPLPVPPDRIDPKAVTHQSDEPIAVAARLFDLIDEARAGRFDVDPLECSNYCPYRRLCRIGAAPQS